MTTTLDGVTADALKLSPAERAELIERIADSVLPAPPLHPAWEAEIARRVAEMDAGLAASIPAEQVLAELHSLTAQAGAHRS
jgi:putative addiction module component (TIGR02574 family)